MCPFIDGEQASRLSGCILDQRDNASSSVSGKGRFAKQDGTNETLMRQNSNLVSILICTARRSKSKLKPVVRKTNRKRENNIKYNIGVQEKQPDNQRKLGKLWERRCGNTRAIYATVSCLDIQWSAVFWPDSKTTSGEGSPVKANFCPHSGMLVQLQW
eukprot:CAMPEP_0184740246 /NCGR_PEP_ID=MMETSP0315-20130426/3253_1 /TAXON_ID=101924 /ORGANISM="Rhodosorus marinus, Strain UTEX LB 2760" /LENGTH=157 /DNA_ID=CAMNT_0027209787 /DNA_START=472 /DNA_END=945 /DNA_ORIENTATION=-